MRSGDLAPAGSASGCGWRARACPRARIAPRSCRHLAVLLLLVGRRRVAGEDHEDVIESWAADRDVLDADADAVQAADRVGDYPVAATDLHPHHPVLRHRTLLAHLRERRHRGVGLNRLHQLDLETLAADTVLELVRGALR